MPDAPGQTTEIVALGGAPASRGRGGVRQFWERLAAVAGPPADHLRIIVLDPGVVDAGPTPAWRRPARAAALRFAFPDADRGSLRHLIASDRTIAAVYDHARTLATAAGAPVLAGTAIAPLPRTHWESWPLEAHVFHAAWLAPPGDAPPRFVRDPDPAASLPDPTGVVRGHRDQPLDSPLGPVGVLWTDASHAPHEAALLWLPRRGTPTDPARALREAPRARAAVASTRGAPPSVAVRGPDDSVRLLTAQNVEGPETISVVRALVEP